MISEATPAVTPMTEITVITPITACRRLARRYRAATKSSNLTPDSSVRLTASCGPLFVRPEKYIWEERHCPLIVSIAIAEAHRQLTLLQPDHQGKSQQQAKDKQSIGHNQTAADC